LFSAGDGLLGVVEVVLVAEPVGALVECPFLASPNEAAILRLLIPAEAVVVVVTGGAPEFKVTP